MKGFFSGFCLVLCVVAVTLPGPAPAEQATETPAGTATSDTTPHQKTYVHPREKTYMKRTWGIEVLWVREASAGYMLEFRYKVLDPEKAIPLFDRQTKPVLIDEKSGARLGVPAPAKIGALRNSNKPKEGKVYWMFFSNTGKIVKSGDSVSIEIGDYLQKHIIVK